MADVPDFRAEEDRIRAAYARRRQDGRYAWSNLGHLFMMQDIERRLRRLLAREAVLPLEDKRILEIGCGTGYWLREFVRWGADPAAVAGVDLLADRVAAARRLCSSETHLLRSSAAQ